MAPLYLSALATAMLLMFALWGVSLYLKDVSIVDRFWGVGFALISLVAAVMGSEHTPRSCLVTVLVLVWATRLSLYIHLRNRGKPEDVRYQQMRRAYGEAFWWKSYFIVFLLQGFLMWVLSAPLVAVHVYAQGEFPSVLDFLGLVVWTCGFVFESVGDYQLARFKRDSSNRGKVCRVGLWNWTRHPNYFGEALIWWGLWIILLNTVHGGWWVFSPVLMTFLLLRVSGVRLLEDQLKKTKPGYEAYVKEVPPFFPRVRFWQ